MDHIKNNVESNKYTKLDHGLTRSDLNPKNRQNYRSCVKLTSEGVSRILIEDSNSLGTHVYLKMLKMIIAAYIEKSTSIAELDDTTVPPSDFNQSHDLEWEIDDSDDNDDDNSDIDAQIFNELLDVDDEQQNITSVKTEFQGINIRDHIDSDDIKS
ncbi:unnamed protein product, partial [Rotaria sp. Silwood2]